MSVILRAVLIGMAIAMAGTIPRNLLFAANLRYLASVPWAVPVTGVYLWLFWRYLRGDLFPDGTSDWRRDALRANRVTATMWAWSLLGGGLGIVTLVIALRVANRLVTLPAQQLPDFGAAAPTTVLALLVAAAPIAGLIEESAFRGYMQGPIERRYGLWLAVLVNGVMFAVAHLDFTPILLPYYVAVAAIYGVVTAYADSILPAIVLHTAGNLYSNFDLWLHGQAEWQAPASEASLVWTSGADRAFWTLAGSLAVSLAGTIWIFMRMRRARSLERAEGRSYTSIGDTA